MESTKETTQKNAPIDEKNDIEFSNVNSDTKTAEQTDEQQTTSEQATEETASTQQTANETDSIEDKLQKMGEKLAEKEDQYRRLYADFENHRRRTSNEKNDLILNGGKDVIKDLLPIIDDMERAVAFLADDNEAKEGMQLILTKMLNTLSKKGLKPMESINTKFDEERQEAVTRIPATTPEQKGMVIDEIQKGYYLNDKVLRFAKVVVAF